MSPSLLTIKRNGKPERVLFIPIARDCISPVHPGGAASLVAHPSAGGRQLQEA